MAVLKTPQRTFPLLFPKSANFKLMYYIAGCCTLILLQLWSSQSPTAVFLCSAILLVYLFQQTWGFIPFFFVFMQTPVERDSPRVECTELPCPWCCVSLSIDAGLGLLPLLCHLCGSTCCCSTWSSPLWLFREKDTPLYFQRPLVLCGFAQKLKFYSKA